MNEPNTTGGNGGAVATCAGLAGGDAAILLDALKRIAALDEEPFELPADWEQQIAACPECQGWAKNHPIQQGICNVHRQPLWARERHSKNEREAIGYRAKRIAREAVADFTKDEPANSEREPR